VMPLADAPMSRFVDAGNEEITRAAVKLKRAAHYTVAKCRARRSPQERFQ
jgi:hypothetical protein